MGRERQLFAGTINSWTPTSTRQPRSRRESTPAQRGSVSAPSIPPCTALASLRLPSPTTDPLRIGDVELVRGPGPIRTQRTLIQQRPGIDLAFDKAMEPGIEVGRGQWLAIAQLRVDDPTAVEPEVAIRTWRARARSAVGLACVVLDDRLAIDELFEDVILFSGDEPVAAADQVDLLRSYLPYEVTGAERAALDQLAKIDLDERGDPAVRAARWYLRAIELGPTAEAVIFFWCALEALAPKA